jgi:hypothetical protein
MSTDTIFASARCQESTVKIPWNYRSYRRPHCLRNIAKPHRASTFGLLSIESRRYQRMAVFDDDCSLYRQLQLYPSQPPQRRQGNCAAAGVNHGGNVNATSEKKSRWKNHIKQDSRTILSTNPLKIHEITSVNPEETPEWTSFLKLIKDQLPIANLLLFSSTQLHAAAHRRHCRNGQQN